MHHAALAAPATSVSGRRRTARAVLSLLIITALPLLASCADGSVEPIGQPGSMSVSPAARTLEVGETFTLQLTADGQSVSPGDAFWSSSAESVARVSESGTVTAVAPGDARISASIAGRSATSDITVEEKAVREVRIAPLASQLVIGETVQLSATVRAGDGSVLDDRDVEWNSEHSDIATVSSSGLVRAVSTGVTLIRATSEGITGEAQVTVTQRPVARVEISPSSATLEVGEAQQFAARAFDADDDEITGRTVQWSVDNSSIAEVSSSGQVTGRAPGTATLTAGIDGRERTARIDVELAAVAEVVVSPNSATLDIGGVQEFSVTLRDARGAELSGRSVSWTVTPASVATINGNGRLTAVGSGSASVRATAEGRDGTAGVTVRAPVVDRLEISGPGSISLRIFSNRTRQLNVTAYDAADRPIPNITITWSSENTNVARVSASGLVTAAGPGATRIVARAPNGVSASVNVTVGF